MVRSFVPAVLIADDEVASHHTYSLHLEEMERDGLISLLHAYSENDVRLLYLDNIDQIRIIIFGGFRDSDIFGEFREVFRGIRVAGENNPFYRDLLIKEGAMVSGGRSKGEAAVMVKRLLQGMVAK